MKRFLLSLFVIVCANAEAVLAQAQSIYTPYYFGTVAGLAPGSADGTGNAARFQSPRGVAVDIAGNVYVADLYNDTIRKITPAGVVTTLAGLAGSPGSADGIGSAARFNLPSGVAVDSAGNIYVADYGNNTIRKITPAGVVSTLAGLAGSPGSADGTGSAARFNVPWGVAVDSAGNVYVADTTNSTIRKITPAGVVSTLAGLAGRPGSVDGTGSAARLYFPRGVAVDNVGNVYVADAINSTIRKITPAGVVTTLAGLALNYGSADGTGSAARFSNPYSVAVDSAGNVYVADTFNHTTRKITPAAVVSTLAGLAPIRGSDDGTGSAARFNQLEGVAADSAGNVYVADSYNHTIRQITSAGGVTTLAGLAGAGSADGTGSAARFNLPAGVAIDSVGNVYVADNLNNTIRKITPTGVSTVAGLAGSRGSADGTGSAARFSSPYGVAVDNGDNVFVADQANSTIRKITPAGVVNTLAGLPGSVGSADGAGSAARFNFPEGVAVDSGGNVYVGDTRNHTTRKITPAGVVTTLAGLAGSFGSTDGTGSAARFRSPSGVAVDSAGNVYVVDSGNHTIRKITPAAVVTTLAGLAGTLGSADGTGSAARFNSPKGVAVDSAGNIYVADQGNNTIRQITPTSVVSTLGGLAGNAGSADGTGSAARFYFSSGVAVGNAGYLYVADYYNNTIRFGELPLTVTTAVSRKTHGSVGAFDVNLALSGTPSVECRIGGTNGDHTLILTFSMNITSGSASVTGGSGSVSGTPIVSMNMMTVNLTGIVNAQTTVITLDNVTDAQGQLLPATSVSASFLLGDTNGNGSVNTSDIAQTKSATGQTADAANFRTDVNISGAISAADIALVKSVAGTALPP